MSDSASIAPPARGSRRIARAIDAFWLVLKTILDVFTYLSIRLYGIEDCSLTDIRAGRYDNSSGEPRNLDKAKDLDSLLAESKECLSIAGERRQVVTDKCKTLLTLGSLLLAIIGALLPKSFAFDSLWLRLFCFMAILCLLNTVILLLVYFAVGTEQTVSLSQAELELESDNLKKSLINQHFTCESATDNRTDYLADIYKVARFFFMFAFFIIVGLFAVNYFSRANENDTKKLVEELRANPDLVNVLRGPKGDKGDKGDHGDVGPKGDKGDAAEPCPHRNHGVVAVPFEIDAAYQPFSASR